MLPAPNSESPSLDIARLVLTPAEVSVAIGKNLNELYGMFQRVPAARTISTSGVSTGA